MGVAAAAFDSQGRLQCASCGRWFAAERVAKHQDICLRIKNKRRQPFDSYQQRKFDPLIHRVDRKTNAADPCGVQTPHNNPSQPPNKNRARNSPAAAGSPAAAARHSAAAAGGRPTATAAARRAPAAAPAAGRLAAAGGRAAAAAPAAAARPAATRIARASGPISETNACSLDNPLAYPNYPA